MPSATSSKPSNEDATASGQSSTPQQTNTDVYSSNGTEDMRTEAEKKAADELYEENIQLEYEKREGGA